MFEMFPDLPLIKEDKEATMKALKEGDIEDLRIDMEMPIDSILFYGLDSGFLKEGLTCFPDPRKNFDIPIDILILPQIAQRLDDEHNLLLAPYMINSAKLVSKLGYNVRILDTGFNNKNKKKRETIFNGETVKHLLLSLKPEKLISWFNDDLGNIIKKHSPGRTHQYIMDGTKLTIPKHLYEKFQGAGVVENQDGTFEYGYKVVWILEIIDRKGVIRALKFAPINEHDLPLGRELVKDFAFEESSILTMDRGFIDLEWITELKNNRNIDVSIPLRKNSEVSQYAIAKAVHKNDWEAHPNREKQKVRRLSKEDLDCHGYSIFESGVLVNFKKKNNEEEYVVFVDTRKDLTPKQVLDTYDMRSEIEESHRQMKCFQGLEKLPSKKYIQVIFRVIMGAVTYNLFNLFLNSEGCKTLHDFTLKILRQKREPKRNPEMMVYTKDTFMLIRQFEFMKIILSLKKKIQKKLYDLFEHLDTNVYSSA